MKPKSIWILGLCVALPSAITFGLSFGPGGPVWEGPDPLPELALEDAVPFPAWVPASTRGDATAGRTNVLGLVVRWVFPPPHGRPGLLSIGYSNRLDRAFEFGCGLQPHGTFEPSGMLLFALHADGGRAALTGFPQYDQGPIMSGVFAESNAVATYTCVLTSETLSASEGSEGLIVAYAGNSGQYQVAYWSESTPLSVPIPAQEPGVAGSNEWAMLKAHWLGRGLPYGDDSPIAVVDIYPEFARFYPGVILDTTLPETFRLEFAKEMPRVDAYDPRVAEFITNAVDKTGTVVIAALQVLKHSWGATPEEEAARDAADDHIYAMSLDVQNPLLFRLHAAHTFPMRNPIEEFNFRTEPHFQLLPADVIRGHRGSSYYEADRVQLRAGLTAILTDTTEFIAGPLTGKYPAGATVGQVATIILADLEAKWAAEPARTD